MEYGKLSSAMKARQNKALDRKYIFHDGLSTFRERISRGYYVDGYTESVPKALYNRRKWNRMNGSEQSEYTAKMKEQKTVYRLTDSYDNNIYSEVPKLVYDYFKKAHEGDSYEK